MPRAINALSFTAQLAPRDASGAFNFPMDLFDIRVTPERMHKHFAHSLEPTLTPRRELLQSWADDFPDRDGKFVQEFQQTFNSGFWELYLHAVFREYSFAFDWSQSAPDFSMARDGMTINVEAVTANAAAGKTPEWEAKWDSMAFPLDLDKLNREAMIRIANALDFKHRKYMNSYSKLPGVSKHPFVLALAPFEQPFFQYQYNRPIKAVLYDHYVDEAVFLADPKKYPDGPPSRALGFVTKENGADIELGLFNDDRMREISAVIFSCTATWGKLDALSPNLSGMTLMQTVWGGDDAGRPTYRLISPGDVGETLVDGLQIYHNPFALRPIDPAVFRRTGVVQNYRTADGDWIEEGLKGALFWRMAWNIQPVSDEEFAAKRAAAK